MRLKIEKKHKASIRNSLLVSALLVGVICSMVALVNMNPTGIISKVSEREWKPIPTGDGPHTPGTCAFLSFGAYPHSATPGTTYANNVSNATAYEFRDFLNGEMTGETPYNTAFDFLLKFVVNSTVGYNVSGSRWMDSWVRANLTCNFEFAADIGPLASMTIVQIQNNTAHAWYYAYMNNGGAGYQITKGESYNCSAITSAGYW